MKKVFVVTARVFPRCEIKAVFSTRSKAEDYVYQAIGTTISDRDGYSLSIEEMPIDQEVRRKPLGIVFRACWSVRMEIENRDLSQIKAVISNRMVPIGVKFLDPEYVESFNQAYVVFTSMISEAHVMQMAEQWIVEKIASEA